MKRKVLLLLSLTKIRLTAFVVMSAMAGIYIGNTDQSSLSWIELIAFLLGTFGVVAAANTLNCYYEIDVDRLMKRTAKRPLVTGEITPKAALLFGWTLAIAGSFLLAYFNNLLTAFLGFLGFALYVWFYTPLKKKSMHALSAGAIPGALPPVMGVTAITGAINAEALALFVILFAWQIPHFLAIALFFKNDYQNAALKTVAVEMGESKTLSLMKSTFILSLIVAFLPYFFFEAGLSFLFIVTAFISIFSVLYARKLNQNINLMARSRFIFFATLFYLPTVLGAWMLDKLGVSF